MDNEYVPGFNRSKVEAKIADLHANWEKGGGVRQLVLPIGLPGAGKSTFFEFYNMKFSAAIIEVDVLRKFAAAGPYNYIAEHESTLRNAVVDLASGFLAKGKSVCVDDATFFYTAEQRIAFVNDVWENTSPTSLDVVLVNFLADPINCFLRRTNGAMRGGNKRGWNKAILKGYNLLESPCADEREAIEKIGDPNTIIVREMFVYVDAADPKEISHESKDN